MNHFPYTNKAVAFATALFSLWHCTQPVKVWLRQLTFLTSNASAFSKISSFAS